LKPKRELRARFGEARREYVVEREPVRGVRVRVRVYGKLEMGDWVVGGVFGDVVVDGEGVDGAGISVAAGRVVKRMPVERPTTDETGE
jgi:hypothetical protein